VTAPSDGPVNGHDGSEEELLWSVQDGVLECVLNRSGALNALTPSLLKTLAEVVSDVAARPDVRLVAVLGAGGRSFSSGFDLKVLRALGADAHKGAPLETATGVLRDCPKPTIAVVDGYCLGAGMDLAMSCDFRFATPQSRFGVPAIRIGTVYRPRAIERFVDVLGPTVTKQLFALGRQFEADQALLAGIVQLVADRDDLMSAVADWADYKPESATAVQAHKHIVDAFSKTADRGPEFWEPLDALRQRSVNSDERKAAVEAFSTTRKEGS
jgi:enoyl-CoA hydratase